MIQHPVQGHELLRESLAGSLARGQLPATLLLHGPRGVGKQRLALWLAQLILCTDPDAKVGPCGACGPCRTALELKHPDMHWFFPLPRPTGSFSPDKLAQLLEAARWDRIDQLREKPLQVPEEADTPSGIYLAVARSIRKAASRRPSVGDSQVFIVSEAQLLVPQGSSPEAANALLKMLEEPAPGSTFILTSSEPGRLLDTIRSRSVSLHLSPLGVTEVGAFLRETMGVTAEEAERAARLGRGSIGRAMGFLDDDGDHGPQETLRRESFKLLRAALSASSGAHFRFALLRGTARGRSLAPLLDGLEEWVRDLVAVVVGADSCVVNSDALETLRSMAKSHPFRLSALSKALRLIHETRASADGNANPQLALYGLLSGLASALAPPNGAPVIHG